MTISSSFTVYPARSDYANSDMVKVPGFTDQKSGSINSIQAHHIFSAIKGNVDRLLALPKQEAMYVCKVILSHIQDLISHVESLEQKQASQVEKAVKELENIQQEYVDYTKKIQMHTKNLGHSEAELKGLNHSEQAFHGMIAQLDSEIKEIEKKIEEEEIRRYNALLDMNPLFGFYSGLANGQYSRMIPFYSSLSGLGSVCFKDKENYQQMLYQKRETRIDLIMKINTASNEVNVTNEFLSQYRNEIVRLNSQCALLDDSIKKSGKLLTIIKDVTLSLKNLSSKYVFLSHHVEILELNIEVDLLDEKEITSFNEETFQLQNALMAVKL